MLFLFYWQISYSLFLLLFFHILHSSICRSLFSVCFSLMSPVLFLLVPIFHFSSPLDVSFFMPSKESQWIAAPPSMHTHAHTQIHQMLNLLQLLHHCSLSNRILAFSLFSYSASCINQCSATLIGVTVMQEMSAQKLHPQWTVLQKFFSPKQIRRRKSVFSLHGPSSNTFFFFPLAAVPPLPPLPHPQIQKWTAQAYRILVQRKGLKTVLSLLYHNLIQEHKT